MNGAGLCPLKRHFNNYSLLRSRILKGNEGRHLLSAWLRKWHWDVAIVTQTVRTACLINLNDTFRINKTLA